MIDRDPRPSPSDDGTPTEEGASDRDPTPRDPRVASRRLAWVLVIALCAVGGLLWWVFGDPIVESVRWEKEPVVRVVHGVRCPAYAETPRGSDGFTGDLFAEQRLRVWHPETGFLVMDARTDTDGQVRTTLWSPEGKVVHQSVVTLDLMMGSELITEPPWRWGFEDQDEPSIPADLRNLDLSGTKSPAGE